MDFILNERSLHGQFQSTEHFLESLQEDLRCFELVRKQKDGLIRKVTDLYKRPITKELTLGDLKYHIRSERLLRLKIALDKEMRTEPYWDLEPAHDIGRSYWLDDGLEYKKYPPSSTDDDRFHHATYRHLSIMKFRFSDKMRCFGYRKGDRFRLLRIERDHKRSDKG